MTGRAASTGTLLALALLYIVVLVPSAGQPDQRIDPLAPEVRAIELALRDDRPEEALKLVHAVAGRYASDPFPVYLQASALRRLERWSDEAAAWERYVSMANGVDAACPAAAVAYERAGDPVRSIEWYRRCASASPSDPDRWLELSRALARAGQPDAASAAEARARELGAGRHRAGSEGTPVGEQARR